MSLAFYLNRVHNNIKILLDDYSNATTFEEQDDILTKLETLELNKEQLQESCIFTYKHTETMVEEANRALKLAQEYKQKAERLQLAMKDILSKTIQVGEKIQNPDFNISWRKSKSVEIFNAKPQDYANDFPHLVKTQTIYQFDKASIKEAIENNEILPQEFQLVTKNNIQIK